MTWWQNRPLDREQKDHHHRRSFHSRSYLSHHATTLQTVINNVINITIISSSPSPLLIHTKSLSSSTRTTRNSMLLFCQPITAKIFLHLSRVWTLFAFGFVKMAWPSTQQNQSLLCLAHQKSSNLFPVWNPVTSMVQTFNSLIKLRSLGHARLQSRHTPYQGFIQFLLLSYSIVQANSFIFRWWYGGRFCRVMV